MCKQFSNFDMLFLRCFNCTCHRVARQSNKRLYSLYYSCPVVTINKQFCKSFDCQFPFTVQLKSCFSTSPFRLKKKKVKVPDDISLYKGYACERGKDAVPHSVLVSKLEECSSVSEQFKTLSSMLSLTKEDREKRTIFCEWLEDFLRPYLPKFKLYQFGSTVTGLGFKGCDLDVCLRKELKEEVEENISTSDIPNPEDVESGRISPDTIASLCTTDLTKFLKVVLEKHPDISNVVRINGHCPILKFYNSRHGLFCDLSFQNEHSMQNTALIKFLCNLDERYAAISRVFRYWAKYCGLVDGLYKFSSYSLSVLVMHFLQTRNPPILPPINEITSKSEYVKLGMIEDDNLLLKDLKKFSPSNNSQSVEALFQEFFSYYRNFDFEQVIIPATGQCMSISSFRTQKDFNRKFVFNTVSIQDPYKLGVNLTAATDFDVCKTFLCALQLTCEVLQSESFSNPGPEIFRLSSAFLKPSFIEKRLKQLKEQTVHTIQVPSIPNAEFKVKELLEYGLLFHCISFKPNSNDCTDSNTLLKLRCKTYNKTWHGRDLASERIRVKDNISPLEKEHLISKELASKSDMKKKNVLCEFDCECKESVIDNETKLTVHLNFKKASSLAVFLKEYIPCTLRMM